MADIQDHGKVWNDCLIYISHRIKKQSYATWLKHTTGISNGNGGIHIVVPNRFVAEWIGEHYCDLIAEALRQACGEDLPYDFLVNHEEQSQTELDLTRLPIIPSGPQRPATESRGISGMLNERYTFDNLVVGNFNEFPYAAAMAVGGGAGPPHYKTREI